MFAGPRLGAVRRPLQGAEHYVDQLSPACHGHSRRRIHGDVEIDVLAQGAGVFDLAVSLMTVFDGIADYVAPGRFGKRVDYTPAAACRVTHSDGGGGRVSWK